MNRMLLSLPLIFAPALLAQSQTADDFRGALVTPPLPKPSFVLADTSGRPFDFAAETKGRVTLLFFGYTYCPDQCPMHMSVLGAALKKLPARTADQVKLVFVTTDPERDSPAVLRRWLDLFDRRFIGLTGTGPAIAAAQRMAGVPVAVKAGPAKGQLRSKPRELRPRLHERQSRSCDLSRRRQQGRLGSRSAAPHR